MREVNLRAVDLNLLVVLQVLLEEQHVSKAAVRLQMSQPAVSRALQRLRQTLDDPILVRTIHGYDLSARAVHIQRQLAQILAGVESIMQPKQFDPAAAKGVLKLTALDLELVLLMPPIVRMLREKAPGLRVEIVPQRSDHFELLEQGEVHFAMTGLSPQTGHDQLRRVEVARTGHLCVMDSKHPLAQGELSLDQYVGASHGLVSITGKGPGVMDKALQEKGLQRRVMLRLASFLSVAEFCRDSDLIFTLPEIMANHVVQGTELITKPLPSVFNMAPIQFYLYWHQRFHHDPMCSWIRRELSNLFGQAGGAG